MYFCSKELQEVKSATRTNDNIIFLISGITSGITLFLVGGVVALLTKQYSEIIKNGKNKISEALVIQIETSPTPLYHGEKPFSFICNQLENLGFNLHMFNRIHNRSFKPMIFDNSIYSGLYHLFQLIFYIFSMNKFV